MNTRHEIQFDRQLQLTEIFSAKEIARIQGSLSRLLNCQIEIVEPDSIVKPDRQRSAILWELEPIGYIEANNASNKQLQGAVEVFLILLKEAVRYRMASDLHMETVLSDFDVLQAKHAELQKSENRYRELSEQLEQKVAEQVETIEAAQIKIFQSEKLASIGQLAAGVAHELNSPLAYIQNNLVAGKDYLHELKAFCELISQGAGLAKLKEAWEEEDIEFILEDFPALLDDSLEGVEKAGSIVADLKIFSNINQQKQQLDNINERLKNVLKMITPQIDKKVEVKLECAELPLTLCYPAHLGQVFYNLIQNGVQAIQGEGRISITTSMMNDCICVSIMDTGVGINETDLSRIFDPFFTTKEVGKGTGLGLSIINDVLKAHNGRVEVQSKPGKGSTFTVFLPVRSQNPENEVFS